MSSGCGLQEEDEWQNSIPDVVSTSAQQQAQQRRSSCNGGGCASDATCTTATACQANGCSAPAAAQPTTAGRQLCFKCKMAEPKVLIHQKERVCWSCMDECVMSKVCGPVKRLGLVRRGDAVLVALSGGAGSWALLHVLRSVRSSNWDRPENSKVAFRLGVAHVCEAPSNGADPAAAAAAEGAIRAWMEQHLPGVPLHCARLEEALVAAGAPHAELPAASSSVQEAAADGATAVGRDSCLVGTRAAAERAGAPAAQLRALLDGVGDVTGREDLAAALRRRLLLRLAAAGGYNKVALGTSATATAIGVIADAAKGRGYALPADVQQVDGRHPEAVLIHPLRALSSKECVLLVRHHALPLCEAPALHPAPRKSINKMAEGFVLQLQRSVPSSAQTIVRTAGKLQSFSWNDLAAADRTADAEHARQQEGANALCSICAAPLTQQEAAGQLGSSGAGALHGAHVGNGAFRCCRSCWLQVMATGVGGVDVLQLLPSDMGGGSGGHMRHVGQDELQQRIADCLLVED